MSDTLIDFAEKSAPRNPGWIETPTSNRVLRIAADCHAERRIGIVRGRPGIGKTAAARRYAETTPNAALVTLDRAHRSQTAGLLKIIAAMVGEAAYAGVAMVKARSLYAEASAIFADLHADGRTVLLIVDEAQQASDQLLDNLRALWDEGTCGLLLLGNMRLFDPDSGKVDEARFAPLFDRAFHWREIPRPTEDDVAAVLDAYRVTGPDSRKLLLQFGTGTSLRKTVEVIHKAQQAGGSRLVRYGDLKAAIASGSAAQGWRRRSLTRTKS